MKRSPLLVPFVGVLVLLTLWLPSSATLAQIPAQTPPDADAKGFWLRSVAAAKDLGSRAYIAWTGQARDPAGQPILPTQALLTVAQESQALAAAAASRSWSTREDALCAQALADFASFVRFRYLAALTEDQAWIDDAGDSARRFIRLGDLLNQTLATTPTDWEFLRASYAPPPPVQPQPAPAAQTATAKTGRYVDSVTREPLHRPSCQWAQRISPENREWFATREEAINAGHRPCKVCNP